MKKPIILFFFISALFASQRSAACSCYRGKTQGFSAETEARVLPSNAKGLIFTRYESEKTKPLKSADFLIADETVSKKISAKLTKLNLGFAVADKDNYPNHAIYRIEPTQAFIPGHKYKFTFKGMDKHDLWTAQSQTVSISAKALSLQALRKAEFKFIDKAEIRTIAVEDSRGGCRTSIDAFVQEVAYDFPPELKEFQDSILFFTAFSKDSKNFNVWQYRRSICSSERPGRSSYAFGHDLIYIPVEDREKSQLKRGIQYSFKGTWIAPEIEDKLHSSNEYSLTYELANPK